MKTPKSSVPQGRTLITGASAGIGFEFAHVFAESGHDLVLVARNAERLNELAENLQRAYPVKVTVVPADLSHLKGRESLFQHLTKEDIFVETLVNNAGFGLGGEFTELSCDRQLEMIDLNVGALTHLTHLFLPQMIKRGSGFILNVASTAAFVPGPLMAVYYATKAYVLSFSEALGTELENKGVFVSALCPGATFTEFQKTANLENAKLFQGSAVMSPRQVAAYGYEALMKGKRLAIPGFQNKLIGTMAPFAPKSLIAKIVKGLNNTRIN